MNRTLCLVIVVLLAACGNKKETKVTEKDTIENRGEQTNALTTKTSTGGGENTEKAKKEKADTLLVKKLLKMESIQGNWILLDFVREGSDFELKECDKQTVWQFRVEKAKPMVDGTVMYKLVAKNGADCNKGFRFESSWVVHRGKLFITLSTIGGVEAITHAGVFDSVVFEGDKMILTTTKSTYTFQKKAH